IELLSDDELADLAQRTTLFARLTLGVPLLSSHDDYAQLMLALKQQMPVPAANEKVVFMGHGASHHAFAAYACLDHMMMAQGFPA
ncbi:sirohydrochlorin cobaltochelatase, partial [Xanthomonas citri pv. citri]|nr:sirohydrochlorin cobaltochelatase [Xanthomonas citri pv. citri]